MRRQKQATDSVTVYRHFPVFSWIECGSCGTLVRREWLWSFIGQPFVGGHGRRRYGCQNCFPARDSFADWAASGKWMPARVPTPPPLPPGVRI